MLKTNWIAEFMEVIKNNQNNHLHILFYEGTIDKKQKSHLSKLKEAPLSIYSSCYIGKDSSFLPFLTVKDNLLLGVSKDEFLRYTEDIRFWLHYFKINPDTVDTKSTELSMNHSILLQLVRSLAKQKRNVIINDIELNLPITFIDSLLPTLTQITKEKEMQIFFITNNPSLLSQNNREYILIFNKDTIPHFTKLSKN